MTNLLDGSVKTELLKMKMKIQINKYNQEMFVFSSISLFLLYSFNWVYLKKDDWRQFTYIISTLNSLQCIYYVISEPLKSSVWTEPLKSSVLTEASFKIFEYRYLPDSYNCLYIFSSYLLIDGIFYLSELRQFTFGKLLTVLHHFIGSLGIYMIADAKQGFFLGYYFALTEFSTLFLNISWFIHKESLKSLVKTEPSTILKKISFLLFYIVFIFSRIFTIPMLLNYLENNKIEIYKISYFQQFMAFYASYLLIILNIIWASMITLKLING